MILEKKEYVSISDAAEIFGIREENLFNLENQGIIDFDYNYNINILDVQAIIRVGLDYVLNEKNIDRKEKIRQQIKQIKERRDKRFYEMNNNDNVKEMFLPTGNIDNIQLQIFNADEDSFNIECEGTLKNCLLRLNEIMKEEKGEILEYQIISVIGKNIF